MKHLLIFLLIIFTSCKEKTNNDIKVNDATNSIEKIITEASPIEFNLLDTVLKNLELEKENCKIDLVTSRENPSNSEETIMIIPEIVEEGDHYFELNSYILIVNTNTGEIQQKYFESSKTNEWVSDAVELKNIKIDTAPYIVSENKRAFGVRVYYYGQSRANPFSNETISFFLKTDDSLVKIVDNYSVMEYGGEWDTDCLGEFITYNKVLIMSTEKTNDYFDIIVKNKITDTKNFINEDNDCDAKDIVTIEKTVLKYNGDTYKLDKQINVSFNEIINDITIKKHPLIDSTNFNNFNNKNFYNKQEVSALQLEIIYPRYYYEGSNFKTMASYKIEFSKDFHSLVLTSFKGENEMESVLINYKLNGELIDYKVISYDEMAEGWSSIVSKIEENRLTIKNILWIDEKQETIEIFDINENGRIKPRVIK